MAGSIERQAMKNAALLLLAAFFRNSYGIWEAAPVIIAAPEIVNNFADVSG